MIEDDPPTFNAPPLYCCHIADFYHTQFMQYGRLSDRNQWWRFHIISNPLECAPKPIRCSRSPIRP